MQAAASDCSEAGLDLGRAGTGNGYTVLSLASFGRPTAVDLLEHLCLKRMQDSAFSVIKTINLMKIRKDYKSHAT